MPDKTVKVRVPQTDGEIVVRSGGLDPTTYKVIDGTVSVKESDLPRFLAVIDGSSADTGGK
jgi:hypothetical protein